MMSGASTYECFEPLGRNNCAIVHDGYDKESRGEVIILKLHSQFQSGGPAVWVDIERAQNAPLENTVERRAIVSRENWIVIQKLDGSLKEQLKLRGKLDPELVRSALRRVLRALCSYEEHGIIHGCVKPGNLLHFDQDYVKLNFSPGLRLGGQLATPCCDFRYLAPELIEESFGPVGPGVDLYALGFTALELLLGDQFVKRVPGVRDLVRSADDPGWGHWHTSRETVLPSLAELLPGTPDDLVRVIDRLVKKDVSARYASARDALVDLEKGPDVRIAAKGSRRTPPPAEPSMVPAPGKSAESGRLKAYLKDPKNRPILYLAGGLLVLLLLVMAFPSSNPVVEFTTDPDGASLIINGDTTREMKTPRKLSMPPGKYKITMMLDKHESHVEEILVKAENLKVNHRFVVRKVEVDILSTPEGASVEIDGVKQSKLTPLTLKLKPGTRSLTLTLKEYKILKAKIEIPADVAKHTLEPFELEPEIVVPNGLNMEDDSSIDPDYKCPLWAKSEKYPDLRFAFVRPGEFEYGVGSSKMFPGEIKARRESVAIPFYISTTEVSNAQFTSFLNTLGENGAENTDPELPALNVSFDRAKKFCLSVCADGRLPKEVEWEYAAGDGIRQQPWEGDDGDLANRCRFLFDSNATPSALPVLSLPDSATPKRGIRHLLGNAAEWCENIYEAGNGETTGDPGVGEWPAIRGGSFSDLLTDPAQARITRRASCDPKGAPDVGIRVVVPLPSLVEATTPKEQ